MNMTAVAPDLPGFSPSPLGCWLGGKTRLLKRILKIMPAHASYCELFCGSAGVFFGKKPARAECINDLNGDLVAFFRVIRDRCEEFCQLLDLTLASREEFDRLRQSRPQDDLGKAFRLFYLLKNSLFFIHDGRNGTFKCNPKDRSKWRVEIMQALARRAHARLDGADVENSDWRKLYERWNREGNLFYIDPPYPGYPAGYYGGLTFGYEDLEEMAGMLGQCRGSFILSIPDNEQTRRICADFVCLPVKTMYTCSAYNGTQPERGELLVCGPGVWPEQGNLGIDEQARAARSNNKGEDVWKP